MRESDKADYDAKREVKNRNKNNLTPMNIVHCNFCNYPAKFAN